MRAATPITASMRCRWCCLWYLAGKGRKGKVLCPKVEPFLFESFSCDQEIIKKVMSFHELFRKAQQQKREQRLKADSANKRVKLQFVFLRTRCLVASHPLLCILTPAVWWHHTRCFASSRPLFGDHSAASLLTHDAIPPPCLRSTRSPLAAPPDTHGRTDVHAEVS